MRRSWCTWLDAVGFERSSVAWRVVAWCGAGQDMQGSTVQGNGGGWFAGIREGG